MKYTLPILREKSYFDKDKKLVTEQKRTEETFDFDLVFNSQDKWEKHFPNQAKTMTFDKYAEMLADTAQDNKVTVAFAGSLLKFLFCCYQNDTINTFGDFTALFQTTDAQYNSDIVDMLKQIFEQLTSVALKNSKN